MSTSVHGIGLGLRHEFLGQVVTDDDPRRPDFLEVFPHHFQGFGGRRRRTLGACADRYPIVAHCTGASIGGFDPLDGAYLDSIAAFVRDTGAPWWSDHLCWSGHRGAHYELLPLEFTRESVARAIRRAREAQDRVGATMALENVAAYLRTPNDEMDEAEFTAAVLDGADIKLMLDINNVVVNCLNFGDDPRDFIDRIPLDRVIQMHLSGHTVTPQVVIDTHVCPVPDSVWDLYRYALARAGRMIPTVIEWDTDIPEFTRVLDEVERARAHACAALRSEAA